MSMQSTVIAWPLRWAAPGRGALRFDSRELAGSLGDLGTFLPLALAMALVCDMNIGLIFIFAGLLNIATGWWLRQPLPVQPMKAIAAVAIAEGLSPGVIAASGIWMGVMVLGLAWMGAVDWLVRVIPIAVVRGIQAGIGIKLAWQGLTWLGALPVVGPDSWLVAGLAGLAVGLCLQRRHPVLLYVFLAGLVLLVFGHPDLPGGLAWQWPPLMLVLPDGGQWWTGFWQGAVPQLPLTLLNSVVAVCALSRDYFPGRGIAPREMATSVSLMNLLTVPFGGMPMCHGAGGLAAQYRFGARTGGSVIMLGAGKIMAGLLLGGVLLTAMTHYPRSILAVMVITAGLALAWAARPAFKDHSAVIVVAMTIAMLLSNALVAFTLGCLLAIIAYTFQKQWRNRS